MVKEDMTGETPAEVDPVELARAEAAKLQRANEQNTTQAPEATAPQVADPTPPPTPVDAASSPEPLSDEARTKQILDAAEPVLNLPSPLAGYLADSRTLNNLTLDQLVALEGQIQQERDRQEGLLSGVPMFLDDIDLERRSDDIHSRRDRNLRNLIALEARRKRAEAAKRQEQEASTSEIQAEYLGILANDFKITDPERVTTWEERNPGLSNFIKRTATQAVELRKLRALVERAATPVVVPGAAEPAPSTAPSPVETATTASHPTTPAEISRPDGSATPRKSKVLEAIAPRFQLWRRDKRKESQPDALLTPDAVEEKKLESILLKLFFTYAPGDIVILKESRKKKGAHESLVAKESGRINMADKWITKLRQPTEKVEGIEEARYQAAKQAMEAVAKEQGVELPVIVDRVIKLLS